MDSSDKSKELLPVAYSLCLWFVGTYGTQTKIDFKPYELPQEIKTEKKKFKVVIKVKKHEELSPVQVEEDKHENQLIEQSITQVAKAPKITIGERKRKSVNIENQRPFTEAEIREKIDEQLRKVGWEVDTQKLNFKTQNTLPKKGHNMAIAEWETDSLVYNNGYADYALFIGEQLVGIIEAKAECKDIPNAIDCHCKEYASHIKSEDKKYIAGAWGKYQVPFVFATNGRQYIKQYEIKSGVWFDDLRKPSESPKAMSGWMHPEGLQKLLKENTEALPKLKELGDEDLRDSKGLNMRDYQIEAIHAVNNAIDDGQKNILVATATDTGKTRTFLALIYRFLKSNRFKRILVLVDRNSLGTQAIKCRL